MDHETGSLYTFRKRTLLLKVKETAVGKVVALKDREENAPANILRKVPTRPRNSEVRSREYLTAQEVRGLLKAAGEKGRHKLRDRTLILMMYRHGLRVSEVVNLHWDQIDLDAGKIHVNRLKNGASATHYLEGDEIRALRRVKRAYPKKPFVFITERGGPLTRSTVNKLVARAGDNAGAAVSNSSSHVPPCLWLLFSE